MTFGYVINDVVSERLFALKKADRASVVECFRQLTANPSRRPDFILRKAGERDLQVAVFKHWRITYWIDHYAREVRINDLQLDEE
jgi:hypothetical protein